jgi:uncharacterized membrane protein YkvA (DUF1232 family)
LDFGDKDMKNEKAEKVLSAVVNGTGKTLEFIDKAARKLEPLTGLPIIGGTIAEVQDIISMLDDYYHGRYKKIPTAALLGSLGIIAYLVSPFDLIPDNVPILGFIDDAFIINTVVTLCVDKELERYRQWRNDTMTETV